MPGFPRDLGVLEAWEVSVIRSRGRRRPLMIVQDVSVVAGQWPCVVLAQSSSCASQPQQPNGESGDRPHQQRDLSA